MSNAVVQKKLNQLVADLGVFYIRLHQFHWYVKGSHFFTLHKKFEELYEDVTLTLDEVAERLLAIGGEPYSTLGEFLEHTQLTERVSDKELTQKEMVEAVINDLERINNTLDEGIVVSEEDEDDPSNDLMVSMKADIEKHIWMLQAYLGNAM